MLLPILLWVVTCLTFVGCILNIKKRKECFYVWLTTNLFLLFYNIHIDQYAQATMWFIFTGISVWGIVEWTKEKKKHKQFRAALNWFNENYPMKHLSPRDPERIDVILKEVRTYWKENPDLRLAQLIGNFSNLLDSYYFEDDKLLTKLVQENYREKTN